MYEIVKHAPYRPNARKLTQLFVVGFIASLVALFLNAILTLMGAPTSNIAAFFGTRLAGKLVSVAEPGITWIGMLIYLICGSTLLPLAFDYLADREVLTSRRWVKGHLFAITLWLFVESVLKPLAGLGLFSTKMNNPLESIIISFIVSLAYSLTLEVILRFRIAHELHVPARSDRKAA